MGSIGETSILDIDPETGADTNRVIATTQPASEKAVKHVLDADPKADLGYARSEWLWIRLGNGDLILGVFPQDDTYFEHETEYRV
jgi:hypothetical protein